MRLKNRVAIITGAAQGIGEKMALGLAAEGARVAIVDVENGEALAEEINDKGGEAVYHCCDVSDGQACDDMAQSVNEKFGGIDTLIANAALFSGLPHRAFMDIPVEEWDRVMAVNVRGLWLSVKAVVPYMKEGASIINISTNRIFTGTPFMLHYDASKGAVSAMTRVMAKELGEKYIRVNAIAPGLTMTENVKKRDGIDERNRLIAGARAFKRSQLPEDVVGTAIFLASDDSASITGQTIVVDGGSIMR